ncbi:non-functional NADPH-dependent codeinone reductase 2 [Phtheirospermum japonicum]|uniref:Non-functional NADPH-dependent codeinone reductase 2 n=1 Tax=Phtheirospermum japonicum TaxID=374723 RepID=A0A830D852_9LAMI|nr:non-functional NADPH-dependent codeinone reductase 2 [Phtheirospermum japonicum]
MRSNQVRLNNGMAIPIIGMGTYSFENDRIATENAVQMALKMGYNHFDTAQVYGSEPALGRALGNAISNGLIQRESVFVTSKLWGSHHHDPVSALNQTLMNLGMEYVDMYLVHWPVKLKPWVYHPLPEEDDFEQLDLETTWAGMEKCLEMGLCRGIGVSNFSCKKILNLLDFASVPPAVNQVEMHPMWRQEKLRDYCKDNKIHLSAYSALGGPGNFWGSTAVVENPIIQSIAQKHKVTPAQVALRWGLSKGSSVIVKSFNEERLKENMGALDLKLDDSDILEIEKMEERKIMRGEVYVNHKTSPYKTIQDLWDDEI